VSAGPVFNLHAETPAGTNGTIAVPATERSLVIVDGRLIRGPVEDGYLQISVPGGRHDILVVRT
jgi:hypothetical protein